MNIMLKYGLIAKGIEMMFITILPVSGIVYRRENQKYARFNLRLLLWLLFPDANTSSAGLKHIISIPFAMRPYFNMIFISPYHMVRVN